MSRTSGYGFGRHVLGAAAFAFGAITLFWHDFDTWQQLQSLCGTTTGEIVQRIISVLEIVGGMCMQFRRTARLGAVLLGAIYLFFAVRWIPRIIAQPLVYDSWGNFFEQFSLVSGAWIVFFSDALPSPERQRALQIGRYVFGVCVISFTLEQALYIHGTAAFVPKWIPPSQMFWAIATTVAFALAAIALLAGLMARLASKLTTVMIVLFGLLVWVPIVIADPHTHMNWAGIAQNYLIAGAAWITSDYLTGKL